MDFGYGCCGGYCSCDDGIDFGSACPRQKEGVYEEEAAFDYDLDDAFVIDNASDAAAESIE